MYAIEAIYHCIYINYTYVYAEINIWDFCITFKLPLIIYFNISVAFVRTINLNVNKGLPLKIYILVTAPCSFSNLSLTKFFMYHMWSPWLLLQEKKQIKQSTNPLYVRISVILCSTLTGISTVGMSHKQTLYILQCLVALHSCYR